MNDKLTYRFPAKERLKSRLLIHQLFQNGQLLDEWPVRCLYLIANADSTGKTYTGVTVSKRSFPAATHRNRIKRLLREAWRLHHHPLTEQINGSEPKTLYLMFIYTGKNIPGYHDVENKIRIILSRLSEVVAHHQEVDS